MATRKQLLPNDGEKITILSIDGGGVRGIIPATILEFLEAELQKLDGPNARIADYFDVIAGTSTGSIITAMLAASDNQNRPTYAAKYIRQFCLDECPNIFPVKGFIYRYFGKWWDYARGSKYSGDYLHKLLKDKVGRFKIDQLLTHVAIPAFDTKLEQPIIFSSFEAKHNMSKVAYLSDICIGSSAGPTYLPAYRFETKYESGKSREFNLIDGGLAVNNPTLIAIDEVTKESLRPNNHWVSRSKAENKKKMLVLSLGTGYKTSSYEATDVAKWGSVNGWLSKGDAVPLYDILMAASSDMVDFYTALVFQASDAKQNYLRIQEDQLTGDAASLDNTTPENLNKLIKIGEGLLNKKVSRVNLDNGCFEPVDGEGTNRNALISFAKELSKERKLRMKASYLV